MDDERCRQFFLRPQQTYQRRYEALRAYLVEGQPLDEVADRFGYRPSSLKSMVCRFRAACACGAPPPFFFRTVVADQAAGAAPTRRPERSYPPWPMSDSGA
jgi:hypothetical protein